MRDTFKLIDDLVAPTGGVGYTLVLATFKNRPPTLATKNDVAVVTAIAAKF